MLQNGEPKSSLKQCHCFGSYSNMHDSLALDFFKKKRLKEAFQSYSFSSSPTHLNLNQSHYTRLHRPLSKSNVSKALKTPELTQQVHPCRRWRYVKTRSKSRNTSICRGAPKATHLTGTPWVLTASPSSCASLDKMELEKGPNCLQTHSKAQKGKRYFIPPRAT